MIKRLLPQRMRSFYRDADGVPHLVFWYQWGPFVFGVKDRAIREE